VAAAPACRRRLGARAASLRLAAHLRHGSTALQRDVVAYSSEQAGGGAFGDGAHAAPKALADCAEAVCGAVFLDSGLRLEALWAVARPLLALDEAALGENEKQHPVARLLELCAARRLVCEFERMPADAGARVGVRIGGCLVAQAAAESARAARLAAAVACLADDGVAAAERALQAELEAVIE
jgi:dsRNA-specific ribonuclease